MHFRTIYKPILGFTLLLLLASFVIPQKNTEGTPFWGFFAHKRINRLAVFTLPPEMMFFFKKHVNWISDHAADPDVRRYAVANEASHHYIDLDLYGPPYDQVPRTFSDAITELTEVWALDSKGDSVQLFGKNVFVLDSVNIGRKFPEKFFRWTKPPVKAWKDSTQLRISAKNYRQFVNTFILPRYEEGSGELDRDSVSAFLKNEGYKYHPKKVFFKETISEHGILPWHLQKMQRNLTYAFKQKDTKRILKYCADIGHYIGDAHVPLHTCSNYNGQKSGQDGLHAFWESRIPELFADEQYDYVVGKPQYFADKTAYFWSIVLESNRLTDSVFLMEKVLRIQFPTDRQLCPDQRLGRLVITQCRDFSAAYQKSLNGMVERRMRNAIHAVASSWFTAWVDAGQPDLRDIEPLIETEEDKKEEENLKKMLEQGKILGRPHDH